MSGRLTVSLSALADNYRRLCACARGEVAAVVKADGYGLGAAAVASHLVRQGCKELFVATTSEATRLRQALPQAVIYVLEGAVEDTVGELVAAQLIPVLNTPAQRDAWAPTGQPAAVHVDTGMRRLGFEWQTAAAELSNIPFPVSLFISHFARADEPGHASVALQVERCMEPYQALRATQPHIRLSLCNSAGLLEGLGPEDLGRAGIALYGGNPYHERPNPMTCVATLEGRVMQVRHAPPSTPVGYGGTFVTAKESQLAVVGVGYADGIPRLLSNNGYALVGGQSCPIVGRVSMDLTIIDVTGADVVEGDWAELIGPQIDIDVVAQRAQTLAYEILTGISTRVPREYLE